MSIHIGANKGDIADKILLPGDPLRAKFIAETYFEDVIQYNEVRGMYGYTGTYKGERISVQGSGMGVPSISIYAHELMNEYDVQTLIRVGTCGAMQEDIAIRDVILAQGATTDSQMNKLALNGLDYAPLANFDLLKNAYDIAQDNHLTTHVGNVFTSDVFYRDDAEAFNKLLTQYKILGVEMESTALYTLAAKFNRKALSILTVSDHIITGEQTSAEERQTSFHQMMELALETAIQA
ncbi:MAG TPA: purine-nucleoside phosphorylase [Pseudogracilibacillus sp.]|nr:purine-nucleoside phosphorylase [Pseudogracilibacillus sp.]